MSFKLQEIQMFILNLQKYFSLNKCLKYRYVLKNKTFRKFFGKSVTLTEIQFYKFHNLKK